MARRKLFDFLHERGFCRGEDILTAIDPEQDSEESADTECGKATTTRKALHAAENVGKHSLLSAMCYGHPPGFVFGLGQHVAHKVQAGVHEHRVSRVNGCTVTVTALHVANLPNLRTRAHAPDMNPYVTVQLVMDGIDLSADPFRAHTKPMLGGGTDCHFPENTNARVALPLEDLEAASGACLFVEVLDEPESELLAYTVGRDLKCGSAVVELRNLVFALNEFQKDEAAAARVNLSLYRDAEMKEPDAKPTGGTLRLYIHLEKHSLEHSSAGGAAATDTAAGDTADSAPFASDAAAGAT